VSEELKMVRNVLPAVEKFGTTVGTVMGGVMMWMEYLGYELPFTFKLSPDNTHMRRKDEAPKIDYPKPDGVISFDRLSSVFLSNTNHEEDQPPHLVLTDPTIPIAKNLPLYGEPARLYCPVGVYEVVYGDDAKKTDPRFVINAQNCVHCKTCDIKDPAQNITWVPPEGSGGPNYPNM
jgi:electron-transferring-flavoprotein dehydrogenase